MQSDRRNGFSLLELMTVMAVMFILMGMATMALRGVVRGAGISGGVSIARSVLTQARQQAITFQRPAGVVFSDTGDSQTMTVVTRYGRALRRHPGNPRYLILETDLPWTASELNGTRVYNMANGEMGILTGSADPTDEYSRKEFITTITWNAEDEVGFVVGDERNLPGGIVFGSVPDPPLVIFNADGTARSEVELSLLERRMDGATESAISLLVSPSTGWVEISRVEI